MIRLKSSVRALVLALIWVLVSSLAPAAWAQQPRPVPQLTGRVVDLTNTLDANQKAQLDAQLAAIEQRKGSQVVVLMVPSTQPEAIEDYSIRVAEAWKIGRGKVDGKAVDDGVIVLVAKNDRKVRIEVGYGLEGAIPDALASRIITETLSPHFRQGDFAGGIQATVADLGRLIEGEALPQPWQPARRNAPSASGVDSVDWLSLGLIVLVGGLIATAIFGRVLGSMAGGLGAGFLAGTFGLPMLIAGGVGLVAFVFLLIFAGAGRGLDRLGRGGSGPVVMLPGGWGGGGRGGGGGGGGGFSGGGGGFGGGGASGGW